MTLIRSLRKYYSSISTTYNVFDTMATSFVLDSNYEENEYSLFLQRYKELSQNLYLKERMPSKHCKHNMWILKPANMNQGQGIHIVTNLKELKAAINGKQGNSSWIVQKYIERPLLYRGRKFDIRVWVLVTDSADAFLYKDGYIRTSSEEYTLNSKENYVHLTNNCLQVHNVNYSKHEPGNTLSYEALKEFLEKAYDHCKLKPDFERDILSRIKDIVIDTVLAIKPSIVATAKKRGSTFELLGYDFMIDEDLRVWLIEANTNPYLGIPNAYIGRVLPRMLDDLFDLVIGGEHKEENRFELVHCERGSRFSRVAVNVRRALEKVYPLEELKPMMARRLTVTKRQVERKQLKEALITNSSFKEIEGEEDKNSKTRLNASFEVKTNEVKKPSKPRINLEELVADIIKSNNYSDLTLIFEKIIAMIKSVSKQSKPQESREESIIQAMNAMMKSPMISSFILTYSTSLPNILETILQLHNNLSTKLRLFLVLFCSKS